MRRSSRAEITDTSFAFPPTTVDVDEYDSGWRASRRTPQGVVEMEADRWSNGEENTFLWFIWQGRLYQRTFDRYYSILWATRLATEFARDVVEGRVGE